MRISLSNNFPNFLLKDDVEQLPGYLVDECLENTCTLIHCIASLYPMHMWFHQFDSFIECQ